MLQDVMIHFLQSVLIVMISKMLVVRLDEVYDGQVDLVDRSGYYGCNVKSSMSFPDHVPPNVPHDRRNRTGRAEVRSIRRDI